MDIRQEMVCENTENLALRLVALEQRDGFKFFVTPNR